MVSKSTGKIDKIEGGVISGWALDPNECYSSIYCSVNGRIVKKFRTSIDRPDVSAHFGVENKMSGFLVDFSDEINALVAQKTSRVAVEIAFTFDSAFTDHLENSPITISVPAKNKIEIQAVYPNAIVMAGSKRSAEGNCFGHVSHARVFLPDLNLELAMVGGAHENRIGIDIIVPIQNFSLLNLELMAFEIDNGTTRFEGKFYRDTAVDCGAEDIEIDLKCLCTVVMGALDQSTRFDSKTDQQRYLIALLSIVEYQIKNRRYLNIKNALCFAVQLVSETSNNNLVAESCGRILALLWSYRLWGLYATFLEPVFLNPEVRDYLLEEKELINRYKFVELNLRFAINHSEYFSDAERVVDSALLCLYSLLDETIQPGQAEIYPAINEQWSDTIIRAAIRKSEDYPHVFTKIVRAGVNSVQFVASGGRSANPALLTAHNPEIEAIFRAIEKITLEAQKSLTSHNFELLTTEIASALKESPVLFEVVSRLTTSTKQETELLPGTAEHAAFQYLVYSSESRGCDFSRLRALENLCALSEGWASRYQAEKSRYGHLYSFGLRLDRQSQVYMLKPHEALLGSLDQLSDDLSPLIDIEGENALNSGELICFDSIDLGYTNSLGLVVNTLAKIMLESKAQAMIFAPWLTLGGADAYCCTIANVLAINEKVAIFLTEQPWIEGRNRLSPDIEIYSLCDVFDGLPEHEISFALATAIEIANPKSLFNFNSKSLWRCASKYSRRLARDRVFGVMFFCDDLDARGMKHSYLRSNAGIVSRDGIYAIGDSGKYFKSICVELGIEDSRQVSIRFPPVKSVNHAQLKRNYTAQKRLVWSGRFDTQKRLDILIALAFSLPNIDFHVFGFPMLESDESLISLLNSLPNVRNFGRYESFSQVDVDQYDALVVTTQWEGCPNIVLEAGVRGLPVVAPPVGGIREILSEGRGFLSRGSFDDVNELAEMIHACITDRDHAQTTALSLRSYVVSQHTAESIFQGLMKMGSGL
jgi:glycosyltransferase involved in cell wall biosynthesis